MTKQSIGLKKPKSKMHIFAKTDHLRMTPKTLPDYFRYISITYAEHGIFYQHESGSYEKQNYKELYSEALQLAAGLQQSGYKKGDKVIIATSHNKETVTLLWACFLCGLVPTILQAPLSLTDGSQSAEKLKNVYHILHEPLLIVSKKVATDTHIPDSKFIVYNSLSKSQNFEEVEIEENDLAFIQFSSGSTGEPKGIMLKHCNLLHNIDSIIEGLQISSQDIIGNWMPLFHDMGLIGFHITPLIAGANQCLLETVEFIKNPSLWLQMISTLKVSITGSPNFGLALVLRYLKRRGPDPGWNFSSMKAMLNGAEPISVKIMNEFCKTLAPLNFDKRAMMPVYGMAEATLAVSFSPLMQESIVNTFDSNLLDKQGIAHMVATSSASHIRQIVSVGVALKNTEIRIVNHEDMPLSEGQVGHIQLKGPAMTPGYYKNIQATEDLYCGEWMRTGDLGFIIDCNLYISGRHKDIIFMNGKNYFANDLETLACTIEDFTFGKIAIGGYTEAKSASEKIIVFAAGIAESKAKETLNQLRMLFKKNLGLPVHELVTIRSVDFHKTSSGKIQRYKIMQCYMNGDYETYRHS